VIGTTETPRAIDGIDELLAVEGINDFFIGPGVLSKNMGHPPAPPFGQPRPKPVTDRVDFAVKKIREAGKVAGSLVTSDELSFWLERGVRYFYVHSDPLLPVGLANVRKMLGR
jgi:4-hydroxy-2-oxoheptanedioate aldolase